MAAPYLLTNQCCDMRHIVLFIASSIGGYIARLAGSIDWLFTDEDYGYSEFYDSIDTTLMGKRTYKDVLSFGEFPYPDKTNYVFTRREGMMDTENVQFITGSIPAFVRQLKKEDGKDIWLVGGGQINTILLSTGLIDRMILSVHPVILGQGIPLFGGIPAETHFKLERSQVFPSGLVQLSYKAIN